MWVSQSERVLWLCEELDIPYKLVIHHRDPVFAPQSIKDLTPLGQAPVIQDGNLTLAESAACVEYINQIYGHGKLALPPSHKNYADYLYWFHFSNGTFQPHLVTMMMVGADHMGGYAKDLNGRLATMLALLDARLAKNSWLAGEDFTTADIMIVFTLTTMRTFYPLDLSSYPGILAYLQRVAQREGYKKARAKGEPNLELMIDGKSPLPYAERMKIEGKI